jgi:Flp pilus assembly protein TadG
MKAMATKTLRSLLSCTSGAVAPTVALSLVGLIAAGGLAFDYSRLVGMHSELQNAADQAALAAASQLDGKAGATQRAAEAAANLVANSTLISNDADTPGVDIDSVVFYHDKAKTLVVTRDDASTTDDRLAHYVEVTVDGREVFYALTPIV